MPPITFPDYQVFEKLVITDDKHTELECSKYLHYASAYLIPQTTLRIDISQEDRNYFGSTDYVVSGDVLTDTNNKETFAYIWELKAPQVYLFEYDDNKNRCRPTIDYVKAENQLIHYTDQAKADENFRKRFGVMDTRNIRPGGIIIGRSTDRMLKGAANKTDFLKASHSLSVRSNILYAHGGIRILTWDRILSFVRPQ